MRNPGRSVPRMDPMGSIPADNEVTLIGVRMTRDEIEALMTAAEQADDDERAPTQDRIGVAARIFEADLELLFAPRTPSTSREPVDVQEFVTEGWDDDEEPVTVSFDLDVVFPAGGSTSGEARASAAPLVPAASLPILSVSYGARANEPARERAVRAAPARATTRHVALWALALAAFAGFVVATGLATIALR